jgi:hypothetical protein
MWNVPVSLTVDHVSLECVYLKAAQSILSQAVTEALDEAITVYGEPDAITMDDVPTRFEYPFGEAMRMRESKAGSAWRPPTEGWSELPRNQ